MTFCYVSALKVIQSLFALDCVVIVIGWLSVVRITKMKLCCTEIQGDPETPNVFEMKKFLSQRGKVLLIQVDTFIRHENAHESRLFECDFV